MIQTTHNYLSRLILFFSLIVVLLFSTNYNISWIHPESLVWINHVHNYKIDTVSDFFYIALNWKIFEQEPRLSRPLASFFEIIDSIFKIEFANHVFPQPAISITWIFSLILSPLFIYLGLNNFKVAKYLSYLGVAFYLTTPGFLSLVVMSFRTSKPMASFFIVFLFYFISLQYKHIYSNTRLNSTAHNTIFKPRNLLILSLITFCALLFDESSIVCLFFVPLLFAGFFKNKRIFELACACMFFTAISYYLLVRFAMPSFSALAGHPITETYDNVGKAYKLILSLLSFKFDSILFFIGSLFENCLFILNDIFGIGYRSKNNIFFIILLCAHIFLVVIFYKYNKLLSSIIFLIFIFSLCIHTFLMNVISSEGVWGVYWYGFFISLPATLYLIFALEYAAKPIFSITLVSFTILLNLYNFIFTNYAIKFAHYYPYRTADLVDIFRGTINKFDLYESIPKFDNYLSTKAFWDFVDKGIYNEVLFLPAEIEYLTTLKQGWVRFPSLGWNENFSPACSVYSKDNKFIPIIFQRDLLTFNKFDYSNNERNISGRWNVNGLQYIYIFKNNNVANMLWVVSDKQCYKLIMSPTGVEFKVELSPNTIAVLSKDGRSLHWSNGQIWRR